MYEYADSKLSGKNISAPQGMGATIEIAGTNILFAVTALKVKLLVMRMMKSLHLLQTRLMVILPR